MKANPGASEPSIVKLMPQIPIGTGPSAGWFGGTAALPKDMAWPEQDGEKLLFVGQINLAALPRDLWSGLGPRQGWLGIFLPKHWPPKPSLLHFNGPLVEVTPPLPNDADWTRIFNFEEPRTFALPKWPIIIESLPRNELHSSDQDRLNGTLSDPAYHPFNQETVSLLCSCLDEAITRLTRTIIRIPTMKKLRPADAAWFELQKPIMLNSFVRFFELEGRMRATRKFNESATLEFIRELKTLKAYDYRYLRDDDEGYCELELLETKLLDPKLAPNSLRHWWGNYNAGLTNHALKAYTSDPNSLPTVLRERLEAAWRQETIDGLGAMGHCPEGEVFFPYGPESSNEVLLELKTSNLTGWIWGDCYSLVLLIDRDTLRRGDFSSVEFSITN